MYDHGFQAGLGIPLRGLECPPRWAIQTYSKPPHMLQPATGIEVLEAPIRSSRPVRNLFQTHALFRHSKPDFTAIPTIPSFSINETERRHDI